MFVNRKMNSFVIRVPRQPIHCLQTQTHGTKERRALSKHFFDKLSPQWTRSSTFVALSQHIQYLQCMTAGTQTHTFEKQPLKRLLLCTHIYKIFKEDRKREQNDNYSQGAIGRMISKRTSGTNNIPFMTRAYAWTHTITEAKKHTRILLKKA